MTATQIRLYREPRWLYDGDPNDEAFMNRPDLPCKDHQYLYFSTEPIDVARCRELCINCPVFEQCARWVLNNYDLMEFGTMAGLGEQERRRINEGRARFRDWRRTWSHDSYIRVFMRQKYRKRRTQRWILKRRQHKVASQWVLSRRNTKAQAS